MAATMAGRALLTASTQKVPRRMRVIALILAVGLYASNAAPIDDNSCGGRHQNGKVWSGDREHLRGQIHSSTDCCRAAAQSGFVAYSYVPGGFLPPFGSSWRALTFVKLLSLGLLTIVCGSYGYNSVSGHSHKKGASSGKIGPGPRPPPVPPPGPIPPFPGAGCTSHYDQSSCEGTTACSWCKSTDGAHQLCFDNVNVPKLNVTEWQCDNKTSAY